MLLPTKPKRKPLFYNIHKKRKYSCIEHDIDIKKRKEEEEEEEEILTKEMKEETKKGEEVETQNELRIVHMEEDLKRTTPSNSSTIAISKSLLNGFGVEGILKTSVIFLKDSSTGQISIDLTPTIDQPPQKKQRNTTSHRSDLYIIQDKKSLVKKSCLHLNFSFRPYLSSKTYYVKGNTIKTPHLTGSVVQSQKLMNCTQFFQCYWCFHNALNKFSSNHQEQQKNQNQNQNQQQQQSFALSMKEYLFNDAKVFRTHLITYHHNVFFPDHRCEMIKQIEANPEKLERNRFYTRNGKLINSTEHCTFTQPYFCPIDDCKCPTFDLDSTLDHIFRHHPDSILFQIPNLQYQYQYQHQHQHHSQCKLELCDTEEHTYNNENKNIKQLPITCTT
jgi:hypothetical protein